MRIEPYGVGSILHVIKRGARGMEIVRDEPDRKRYINALYILNDEFKSDYWADEVASLPLCTRPDHWPERKPLIDILAWTLMPNHIHFLLRIREDRERGLPEFTQKIFRSMTGYFNEKYDEKGSIFQGPYKSRTVDSDEYLRYVIPYIVFKNTLELHPRGLSATAHDFDDAWEWAIHYPYSSLSTHVNSGETVSPILFTFFKAKRRLVFCVGGNFLRRNP
ncbi:hypothetical protein FJY94_03325 [Candidatus Kaiserbacteria bacterium]|nr:hypothetical protein [Candidatus Kaiserbacteria bacterium]